MEKDGVGHAAVCAESRELQGCVCVHMENKS